MTSLSLASISGTNKNRITSVGIKALTNWIQKTKMIQILNLQGNHLWEEGINHLMPTLSLICPKFTFNHIVDLNISSCFLNEAAGIQVSKFLNASPYIESLNISDNPDVGIVGYT